MYPAVIKVLPQADYTLRVHFDNGEKGVLDVKPLLKFGVFSKLENYDNFRLLRVGFDTITWDYGVDLDPEFVYDKCLIQSIA